MPVAFIGREAGGRWKAPRQLTTEGGQDARWSPDGGEIAYLRNGGLLGDRAERERAAAPRG